MSSSSLPAEIVRVVESNQLVQCHRDDLTNVSTDPNAAPLSDQELEAAKADGMINTHFIKAQLSDYRKFRTSRQYKPVSNQEFAVLSFVPSSKAKPDEDNCFGIMRLGGNFGTAKAAQQRAEELLRLDSTREYLVTYVGVDFPVTSDDASVLVKDEIDLKDKEVEILRQNERRQEELEETKAQEIEDARNNLLQDVKRKRVADDIDTYIENCVKQANAEAERAKAIERIVTCNRVVAATQVLLADIIGKHPEYKKQAASAYNKQCTRVGLDPKQVAMADFIDFEREQEHKVVDPNDIEAIGNLTLN